MGVVKLPKFVLERFEVVIYEASLGVKFCQIDSGQVCILEFIRIGNKGMEKGPIECHGKVQIGDALLTIDQIPIEMLTYNALLKKLNFLERPVTLGFGRVEENIKLQVQEYAQQLKKQKQKEIEQTRILHLLETKKNTPEFRNDKLVERTIPVYTAKDFKGKKLRPLHRIMVGVLFTIVLLITGFIFDLDVFNMTSAFDFSQSGTVEVFHAKSVKKIVLPKSVGNVDQKNSKENEENLKIMEKIIEDNKKNFVTKSKQKNGSSKKKKTYIRQKNPSKRKP